MLPLIQGAILDDTMLIMNPVLPNGIWSGCTRMKNVVAYDGTTQPAGTGSLNLTQLNTISCPITLAQMGLLTQTGQISSMQAVMNDVMGSTSHSSVPSFASANASAPAMTRFNPYGGLTTSFGRSFEPNAVQMHYEGEVPSGTFDPFDRRFRATPIHSSRYTRSRSWRRRE